MYRWLILFIGLGYLCVYPSISAAQEVTPSAAPADTIPLSVVIPQVQAALDEYQKNRGGGADALPPLASAEFDFKATTGTTIGVTINLLIFKFGASHENDYVNDVTYTYTLPKPSSTTTLAKKKPPALKDALAQTIQSAAASVKTATTLGKLSFSKLAVSIQYGVKWDVNAGASGSISFVTVGLNADRNKNTVQSVKLVFGNG